MIIYRKRNCSQCKGEGTVDRKTINSKIDYSNPCPNCSGSGIELKSKLLKDRPRK